MCINIDIIYILELSATWVLGWGFLPRFLKFELSKVWPQSAWATQKPMTHWAKYWVHPTLLHTYVLLSHFWPYRLALTKAPSFLSRSSMRPFRVRLKLNFSHFLGRYLFLRILNHTCFFLKIAILSKVPLLATLMNVWLKVVL